MKCDYLPNYSELQHYAKRLETWQAKAGVKVEITTTDTSYFDPKTKTVFIRQYRDGQRRQKVMFHELGHHFLNASKMEESIDIEEFFDEIALLESQKNKGYIPFNSKIKWNPLTPDDLARLMNDWADIVGSNEDIRIISDIISCLARMKIPGYTSHDPKDGGRNYGPSEGFAELFSVICTRDYSCFNFMIENFPDFVNSCLFLIDSYLMKRGQTHSRRV